MGTNQSFKETMNTQTYLNQVNTATEQETIIVKVCLIQRDQSEGSAPNEFRRFVVPTDTSFAQLLAHVRQLLGNSSNDNNVNVNVAVRLTYRDEDNDEIVFSSDAEWRELLQLQRRQQQRVVRFQAQILQVKVDQAVSMNMNAEAQVVQTPVAPAVQIVQQPQQQQPEQQQQHRQQQYI